MAKIDVGGVSLRERLRGNLQGNHPFSPDQLLEVLYRLELAVANQQSTRKNEWEYIPYSHSVFFNHIKEYASPKSKFLEVGCGIGTKLYMMYKFIGMYDVTGIEINSNLVKLAHSMFDDEPIKVLHQDALTFENYGDYDVIYSYSPIKGSKKLFEIIKEQMKPGATFHFTKFYSDNINFWIKPY